LSVAYSPDKGIFNKNIDIRKGLSLRVGYLPSPLGPQHPRQGEPKGEG